MFTRWPHFVKSPACIKMSPSGILLCMCDVMAWVSLIQTTLKMKIYLIPMFKRQDTHPSDQKYIFDASAYVHMLLRFNGKNLFFVVLKCKYSELIRKLIFLLKYLRKICNDKQGFRSKETNYVDYFLNNLRPH
jgi:hypothetical protein